MTYRDTATELAQWRAQIAELRRKMREVQASVEPEPVHDYILPGRIFDKKSLTKVLSL